MIERLFGGDAFLANTRALDASVLRQQVIANNLANVNTPNFKRQEVVFEDRLEQALQQKQNPCASALCAPISALQPSVVTINTTGMRADGNNVDMEAENVGMAVNELRFQTLAQSISDYFSNLKSVITSR